MWKYAHADELLHYGVKGMKWGVRRYQNPDGSLTAAGKRRQEKQDSKWRKKVLSSKVQNKISTTALNKYLESFDQSRMASNFEHFSEKFYRDFMRDTMNDIWEKSVKEVLGDEVSSPSNRYKIEMFVQEYGDKPYVGIIDDVEDRVAIYLRQ